MSEEVIDVYENKGEEINKERDRLEKIRLDRRNSDINFLKKFPQFRRFCGEQIEQGKVFSNDFPNPDTHRHYFDMGRRSASVSLLNKLNMADPQLFFQICREKDSEDSMSKKQNTKGQ